VNPQRPVDPAHTADTERHYKPAPWHNPLKAPGVCLCVECCRIVADLRCTATNKDGVRCGDYRWHRKSEGHTMLINTVFLVAEERLQFDGPEGS
jgi:hypothetical protein